MTTGRNMTFSVDWDSNQFVQLHRNYKFRKPDISLPSYFSSLLLWQRQKGRCLRCCHKFSRRSRVLMTFQGSARHNVRLPQWHTDLVFSRSKFVYRRLFQQQEGLLRMAGIFSSPFLLHVYEAQILPTMKDVLYFPFSVVLPLHCNLLCSYTS